MYFGSTWQMKLHLAGLIAGCIAGITVRQTHAQTALLINIFGENDLFNHRVTRLLRHQSLEPVQSISNAVDHAPVIVLICCSLAVLNI